MKKLVMIGIIVPVIIAILGIGGFFIYNEVQGQHEQNLKDLEKFGFTVLPSSNFEESTGKLGEKQLPPTFGTKKLTPTQKVIQGLMDDNKQLINEQHQLQQHITDLKAQVAELENYKKLNEHFAPLTISEEIVEVEKQIKKLLIDMPDARRFSNLQIEAMSASVGNEYKKFIGNKRIIFSDSERESFIESYMPEYAFCVGDGIEIAANSPREERTIATYFRKPSEQVLSTELKIDIESVVKPCQTALYSRLDKYDQPL
ncbi:MAG: hypothetical protein ACRBB6_05285 [Neptuniibacter sp.]